MENSITSALARACTHHIKNTLVVCRMSKILYGVLPHLFLIHSFSTLLITLLSIALANCSVHLY